jgi:hypothetical protein
MVVAILYGAAGLNGGGRPLWAAGLEGSGPDRRELREGPHQVTRGSSGKDREGKEVGNKAA